ncbi:MAG: S8 family peptidase [Phenylobacterium sp.]|nr:S8 family peptidase [Phenylobacterium sp.]
MRAAGLAAALLLAIAPAAADARAPRPDTDEYRKSWGLAAIGAPVAYAAGYSGRGVTVAVVDCGLERARRDVRRNVSDRSTDVVADRASPLADRHGSYTTAPLAAALDGRGMVGVAYNATVLSVRADVDGGFEGRCAFRTGDLAAALDYAATERARIVVLPLQHGKPLGARFEAALARVIDTGAVVVIAAGNRNGPDPSWPALYAIDPRFEGAILVAGAVGYHGAITDWSNRAGRVGDWYVTAPGEWVLTDCADKCALVSGTSFASSYVAGSLALMMEAWPELSGRDLARRLLASARDAGEPGTDAIYGRGVLDLRRTFAAAD